MVSQNKRIVQFGEKHENWHKGSFLYANQILIRGHLNFCLKIPNGRLIKNGRHYYSKSVVLL